MNIFKQKRCNQCGWELGRFSKQDYCSERCSTIWNDNEKEYESIKKMALLENMKSAIESELKIQISYDQLENLLDKIDQNAKKYVELLENSK